MDKDLPGLSCKDISDSHKDLASGVYWIDPTDSSNPFTVFCDMTTDGGEMNHFNHSKTQSLHTADAPEIWIGQSGFRGGGKLTLFWRKM